MKNNEIPADDFLKNLIQKSSIETPSDDFITRVMEEINKTPELVSVPLPLYRQWKPVAGFTGLLVFAVVIMIAADIPILDFLPGKTFFTGTIMHYFNAILLPLKPVFVNSRFVNLGMMSIGAAGLLILIDRVLTRKFTI